MRFLADNDPQNTALENADDNVSTGSIDSSSSHESTTTSNTDTVTPPIGLGQMPIDLIGTATPTIGLVQMPPEIIDIISSYLHLNDYVEFRQKTCTSFYDDNLSQCRDV